MSRIFWDSNLFIYLFENYGEHSERVVRLRNRMLERNDVLITSTLTLGEILVKPMEKDDHALSQRYETVLSRTAEMVPFDQEAARIYARLRKDRSLRPPDAIQLSCAAKARADMFITNDERISGKLVPGIHFIVSLENAVL